MASCLFWGNWILQLCRKSNWIALMWWLITSLDCYAKLTAVSGLRNKWEVPSLLLTCARHFYANVNGFYKSHDFPVKNEKFWRKKKKKWLLKVVRMLGVWTQEFHFSHVSCRFTFARPAYLDSISELLDSCLPKPTIYWTGLHKLWYPSIRDTSTWSKFGPHGEHGDVFLFSNLGKGHFFTPLFFFCNWILHIWNGFYTSKISLLSPLMIGSKLTFISRSGRWLPTIEPCSKSSQLLYIHNIKPKLSAKHVFTVREWF